MEQVQITDIVADVIDRAAKAKGWSLAQLTRQLGKGENTLHRWRTGATTSYDLYTLIKLFKMAGMSMDDSFAIPREDVTDAEVSTRQVDRINNEISGIKKQLQLLSPVANLVQALAATAASMQAVGNEDMAMRGRRAKSTGVVTALKDARTDIASIDVPAVEDEARKQA